MDKEIQELYEEHRKLRELPEYDKIEELFNIADIDLPTHLLKRIRWRIVDNIEEFTKMIEEIISPESSIRCISESKDFDEKAKDEIFKTYKKLMYLNRWSTELNLFLDEDKDAEFIRSAVEQWPGLKDRIHEIIKKIKDSWKKEENIKEHLGYFG